METWREGPNEGAKFTFQLCNFVESFLSELQLLLTRYDTKFSDNWHFLIITTLFLFSITIDVTFYRDDARRITLLLFGNFVPIARMVVIFGAKLFVALFFALANFAKMS